MLPQLIQGREQIYSNFGYDNEFDSLIISWANQLRSKARAGINAPTDFIHIGKITHEMRMQKSAGEINFLRQAAKITAAASLKAMESCCPGMMEYELAAVVAHEFARQGAYFHSFEPIIGGGANSCILHYVHKAMQN